VAYDTVALAVTDAAGPFLVTTPNTAVTWDSGAQKSVTWDVANTDIAPVNCSAVKIRLSTDGGYTYPLTLLNNTANDGSAVVTVPNEATAEARVRVQCASNIFFDISNVDFTIVGQEPPEVLVYLPIVPKEE
jgi:hypothetical protein